MIAVLLAGPALEAVGLQEAGSPAVARAAPRSSEAARRRAPRTCAELVAGTTGAVKADLELVCAAPLYDAGCACSGQSTVRDAFDRLLRGGESERLIALAELEAPVARAFGRDAIERADAWTLERIAAALADDAKVEVAHGPNECDRHVEHLSTPGLRAALSHPDRRAVRPVLRAWARGRLPAGLATALYERGDETWIGTSRLRRIAKFVGPLPALPPRGEELLGTDRERVAAAYALARRGERAATEPLIDLARSSDPWVARVAVETLDRLGHAEAWTRLAPAEPHTTSRICTEPWSCPDHCLHLMPCEEHEGRVCAAILQLGAHLAPDAAVDVIDHDAHGLHAVTALPPRLFASRAAATLCAWRWWESQTEAERRETADLAAALAALPDDVRCEALRSDGPDCTGTAPERAFAIAPDLARACGMDPPPDAVN